MTLQLRRTIAASLAVSLHLGVASLVLAPAASAQTWEETLRESALTNVVLGTGSNNTQRNLVWHTDEAHSSDPKVEIAPASSVVDGQFPTEGVIRFGADDIRSERVLQEQSRGFEAWSNKVEFTHLEPNTRYVYRIGDRTEWLGQWEFTTESGGDKWQFFFMADAQIGARSGHYGYNPIERTWEADSASWKDTLELARATYPDIHTIVSAGDQVNSSNGPSGRTYENFMNTPANPTELEYLGYTYPAAMKELQHAPTLGNHDFYYGAEYTYDAHYNIPNFDYPTDANPYGTWNHWWGQNNVLFLHLNTELNSLDYAFDMHDEWMTKVLAEQRANYDHVVVVMHRPLYSVGTGHSATATTDRVRKVFTPLLKKHHISALLTGHDHTYTRSHPVDNYYPGTYDPVSGLWSGESGEILNLGTGADAPEEVFLTGDQMVSIVASTASGSKYYDILDAAHPYAAVTSQEYIPNYSVVDVDKCSLTYITHRAQDSAQGAKNSVVDKVRVNLPEAKPEIKPAEPLKITASDATNQAALLNGVEFTTCDSTRFSPVVTGLDSTKLDVPQTVTYTIAAGTAWETKIEREVTLTHSATPTLPGGKAGNGNNSSVGSSAWSSSGSSSLSS